jgi:hypothetical protein
LIGLSLYHCGRVLSTENGGAQGSYGTHVSGRNRPDE